MAIYRGEGLRGPPWPDGRGPPWQGYHASAMSSEHRPGPDPAPERLPPPRSIARAPPSRRLVLAHMWEGWLPHLKGSITAGAEWERCRGANLPVS